jgi:uncharacterized protein involved in exopolysaccharide biosynthesis
VESELLKNDALRAVFRLVFHLWRMHRVMILRTALIAAAAGTVTALLLPNIYTSTVVLMPPQQGSSVGATLMAQLGNMAGLAGAGGLGVKNPNDLQISLLKSETVENAMAERFKLGDLYHSHVLSKVRKKWERHTKIENGIKDGLLRISVDDSDPHRAVTLVNGWVEEYKRMVSSLAVTEAQQRRFFFEQQMREAHDALGEAEDKLNETERRTGVIQIDGQAHAMIESAAVMRGQIAAKEVEIRGLRAFATEQNPDLVRSEEELRGLEGQLAQMDVNSRGRTGDLVAPRGAITDAGTEYLRAMREVKYRETVYELLLKQYEVSRVDEAREGSPIQIVDPATVPDRPSSLYRWWIFLGALLLALPVGMAVAFGVEFYSSLRRRVQFMEGTSGFTAGHAGVAQ